MKIGVFAPAKGHPHRAPLLDFAEGVDAVGDEVEVLAVGDGYQDCDVAVVFGTFKRAVPESAARGAVIEAHRVRGRRVIIMDSGYVRRSEFYSVGFDGLNGHADFRNKDMPADRWHALATPLQPWRGGGTHLVVCGQVPWDATVQDTDHPLWCRQTVSALLAETGHDIVFRPHPMAGDFDYGVKGCEISRALINNDLARARSVITFNSNSAVDALIGGVQAYAADAGSMAFALSGAEDPDERPQWAADLAYAQWNRDEMCRGLPWRYLRPGVPSPA